LLILKTGRVLTAGEKPDVLNSKNLFRAFGARIQLQSLSSG
jgi:ABC-type cobalamin transport system ATPase subunit